MSDAATGPASQTLSRGIRILEVLADAREPLMIDQVADRLGVHRSIAYRLLRTLEDHGLVTRDAGGRVAALEILKATLRTREYVEVGESGGKTLLDAMKDGSEDGMQHFDGEIERLLRAGVISIDTAMSYCTNANNLRLNVSDVIEDQRQSELAGMITR